MIKVVVILLWRCGVVRRCVQSGKFNQVYSPAIVSWKSFLVHGLFPPFSFSFQFIILDRHDGVAVTRGAIFLFIGEIPGFYSAVLTLLTFAAAFYKSSISICEIWDSF